MLAAGLSRRMGGPNKLLRSYQGKPLLAHALGAAEKIEFLDRIAVTGRDSAETERLGRVFRLSVRFQPPLHRRPRNLHRGRRRSFVSRY